MSLQPHFWGQSESEQRHLWRTGALLLGLTAMQTLGLWLAAAERPLGVTAFSGVVALLLLLPSLIVAIARPGIDTRLAAVMAILLAGMVVVPFEFGDLTQAPQGPFLLALPFYMLLRLFDGVLVILVGFHLTARFPSRNVALRACTPSDRRIFAIYLASVILLAVTLFMPAGPLRLILSITLFVWMWGLLIWAHWHLLCVARQTEETYQRAAQQARLLLLAFIAAEAPIVARLFFLALGLPNAVIYDWLLLGQVTIPVAVIYAVLRHDLFDIDAGVRRALAYTGVTAVLLSLFLGLTLLITDVIGRFVPAYQTAAVLGTLLTAAVAFRPLYSALQRFVDRLFYPERLRFRAEIGWARQSLQQIMDAEQVRTLLTDELPRRLDLTWATLTLAPAQDVPGPRPSAPVWSERLLVGDRVIGRYWVGARRSGLAFDRMEQDLLRGIVEQAALALAYAAALHDLNELNRSLETQVTARTEQVLDQQRQLAVLEERRRLAHDLHDSVNQTLFSISLGSRALRKLVSRDPSTVVDGLLEQEKAAQQALGEMRALLAQLRAPLPMPGDLMQALKEHAAQIERQLGKRVHVDGPPTLALSEATAAELLLVAREAIHNAIKHAQVDEITCQVTSAQAWVILAVADQGNGFDLTQALPHHHDSHDQGDHGRDHGRGLGLDAMQARMARLGGSLTIDTSPGAGTTVTARLPYSAKEE